MRIRILPAAILALACSLTVAAQDKGYWRASSTTSEAITGDIAISSARVTINFSSFTIAEIRKLNANEVSAGFDADSNAGGSGDLYRLNIPASKRFLRHNTLCGSEDTQWMATYVEGRELHVAFFSGDKMPMFTRDSLANSTDLCGVFSYSR